MSPAKLRLHVAKCHAAEKSNAIEQARQAAAAQQQAAEEQQQQQQQQQQLVAATRVFFDDGLLSQPMSSSKDQLIAAQMSKDQLIAAQLSKDQLIPSAVHGNGKEKVYSSPHGDSLPSQQVS